MFVLRYLQYVSDGQHSVILASHLTNELERIVDYVTFLRKGKLVFSQTIEEMRESYRVLSGEAYKIKLLPKEDVLYMETEKYGARALVRHYKRATYDKELLVERPTMEQLMYFWKKGELT